MVEVVPWLALVLLVKVKGVVADFLFGWLGNWHGLNFHFLARDLLGSVRGHRSVEYARHALFTMG